MKSGWPEPRQPPTLLPPEPQVISTEERIPPWSEFIAHTGPTLFLPAGWEVRDYPGPIARHANMARWILHSLSKLRSNHRKSQEDGTRLCSTYLGDVVGDKKQVSPVKMAMKEARLIEVDEEFEEGVRCKTFFLGDLIRDAWWAEHDLQGKVQLKQVERFRTELAGRKNLTAPVHERIADWADRVQIDLEGAYEVVPGLPTFGKRNAAYMQLAMLRNRHHYRTVCPYGRLHHNWGGLCRELRPFLSVDGERLANVDIKTSQPTILVPLLRDWLAKIQTGTRPDPSPAPQPKPNSKRRRPPGPTPTIPVGFLFSEDGLVDFEDAIRQGTLYDDLVHKVNSSAERESDRIDRNTAKKRIMALLYGEPGDMLASSVGQAFRDLFETVFFLLVDLKVHMTHQWVPQEMQRRESDLVILSACSRLMVERPEIPIISIHDSVMTHERHLDTVEQFLREALAVLPVQPRFSCEVY